MQLTPQEISKKMGMLRKYAKSPADIQQMKSLLEEGLDERHILSMFGDDDLDGDHNKAWQDPRNLHPDQYAEFFSGNQTEEEQPEPKENNKTF